MCVCFSFKSCVFNFMDSPYGSDFPVVFVSDVFFFFLNASDSNSYLDFTYQ